MKSSTVLKTLGGVLLAVAISTPAQAQTLKLGNEGTYPPFSILGTDGTLSGLEPDLARAMCERMGADCEIIAMDFSALLPSLISGKIDMIASQLTPLPERLEVTEFTIPVIMNPEGFVVPKGWSKGYDNAAMNGIRLGVQKGSSHAKYVETQLPDATPVYYENNDQILLDLQAGRIDGVFGGKINWLTLLIDTPEGKDWMLSPPDFWAAGEKVGNSWAVQKGQMDLVGRVNAALRSLIDDCTYTKIREKYISIQLLEEEAKCM